jgi:hypothetical protein
LNPHSVTRTGFGVRRVRHRRRIGNRLRWCLKSANPRLARRDLGVFALWPYGAAVPNVFPARGRIEAGAGLIMCDGLPGSGRCRIIPVNRSQWNRAPCRNGLLSDGQKTRPGRGPRSGQPAVFRWTRNSASVQIQSPRLFIETSPSANKSTGFVVTAPGVVALRRCSISEVECCSTGIDATTFCHCTTSSSNPVVTSGGRSGVGRLQVSPRETLS